MSGHGAQTAGPGPAAGSGTGATRRRLVALALGLGVAGAAALVLGLQAHGFDPSRLHVHSAFVDQGGYVTTARHLADTGHLESWLVYPAHACEEGWRQYMPGHYAVLALSYLVLGYGVLASLLPNLVAFVLCAVLLFVVGRRLHGAAAGVAAALLFVLFPPNVCYAFTAMAELTFTLAGLVALTVFVHLPETRRPLATPFLLALPFLFRETGAFLVVPLALALLLSASDGPRRERWQAAVTAVLASVVVLGALNAWQTTSGKGAVPLSWVVQGRANYSNAFPEEAPAWGPADWARGLAGNLRRNLDQNAKQRSERPTEWFGLFGQAALLAASLAALVLGLARRRRDPWPLGAGLLGLLMLAAMFLLYDVRAQKVVRNMIFVTPLLALALAGSVPWEAAWRRSRAATGLGALALLGGLAAGSWRGARQAGFEMTAMDLLADSGTYILDRVHKERDAMLAAPVEMCMDYVVRRYPTRVALTPENDATLELMASCYDLATVVVYEPLLDERLHGFALERLGLHRSESIATDSDRAYVVFRRVP